MAFESVAGVPLYYERHVGNGPPLLLCHGAGQDTLSWRYCTGWLVKHFDVVAIDLPGHGKSGRHHGDRAVDDYADHVPYADGLMRTLGYDRYVFMGHSFAGGLGLSLARALPERIAAVVMLDGTGCPSAAWGGSAFDLVAINPIDWMEVNFRLICGPSTDAERVDEISRDVLRCPPDVVQGDIKAFAKTDVRPDLPGMRTPLLALHGLDDWSIPPELGRETVDLIGAPARFVPVPDVGHFPHVEAPDRLRAAFESSWAELREHVHLTEAAA